MHFSGRCIAALATSSLALSNSLSLARSRSSPAFVSTRAVSLLATQLSASSSSHSRHLSTKMSAASSLYDFTVKDANGQDFNLVELKDKKAVLIVNVASQCGFTPQYKGLQELQDKYGPKGFTVLAFPCNQFGGQEPDAAPQVCQFAKDRFKATFPIMDKVDVNGNNAAPVFNFLKEQQPGFLTNAVKWNFSKWLIKDGKPIKRYGPQEKPESIEKDVVVALN
ncbi:hypothetical protein NSK_000448 [Nannochloropsis salina CCMP1776]|uniref:Glutathione peroxidase n=1 Tax=Nannochloropsis salina CCMP1776 TaxID=1027361 RepID=A0A4D9DAR1_9STRA|nr:hypothetical protein NSK_000448 [Nannochloropsis salina CCMP1776]|eukprot:TFJ88094.1 hypothetical protein NSK_000448 [Nannochloropsis salina CCMP1776]